MKKPRYSNVISLLLIFLLISCNNFEKYYPSGTENDIYIDNSNINNFELYMIYNITDTVFDEKKIYIVDTLKFRITEDGVESLNTDQRIKKIIDAGVNLIGGESLSLELARLIKDGIISEEIIDESLRKIMKQKFQLGLFDNPYIDKRGLVIYSNETNKNKGIENTNHQTATDRKEYKIPSV